MVDTLDITPKEVEQEYTNGAKNLQERFNRMDADFKLWDTEKVTYEEGPTSINVTSNKPRTFADNVQTKLCSSERQISVRMAEEEGEDKRDDIAKLERLLEFGLQQADLRLERMQVIPLKDYTVWCSLIRGWAAARILNYKLGKNVIHDYTPLDPRWLVWETGSDGLFSTNYETFRTRASIKREYEWVLENSIWQRVAGLFNKNKDSIPVYDKWVIVNGKIWNCVACQGEWLIEPVRHKMSSIPVIIIPVATRPLVIGDTGANIERYGDSIFASIRDMFEILNEFASMWFTHAKLHAKQPLLNYYKRDGKTGLGTLTLQPEMIIDIPADTNKLEPAPLKDISPTLVSAAQLINRWIEEGSLPAMELTSPPASGTALSIIEEARNRVFGPQLRLLNRFYTNICNLTEEQLIEGGIKVNVKSELERKYYGVEVTPVDLKKPHIIKVEHTSETPWTKLDMFSIADMAKRMGWPDEVINEYILKYPDPKGLADKAAIEIFEHSPKASMFRAWVALMKAGREEEANMLRQDMDAMAAQEGLGGQPQPSPSPMERGAGI